MTSEGFSLEGVFDTESRLETLEHGKPDTCVILVHGIADIEWNLQQRWKTWQKWMAEVGLDSEHTIWRYQYDLRSNYPRIFSPNGIDLEARSLLDCLAEVRANETEETEQKKRFVFVSLDIGGIIVKKALTIATLDPLRYGKLDNMVAALIFANCPHRSANIEHLEDYLGELLAFNSLHTSNSVKKILNLSKSIQEANGAFLDADFLVRSLICNIVSDRLKEPELYEVEETKAEGNGRKYDEFSDSDDDDNNEDRKDKNPTALSENPLEQNEWNSAKRPNRPFQYYGSPCELTYKSSHSLFRLTQEAGGLNEEINIDIKTQISRSFRLGTDINHLRTLQSQSPPVYPPDPARAQRWPLLGTDKILETETYKKWSQQNGLSVLHLYGITEISDFSKALVERLEQAAGKEAPSSSSTETWYFEFNHKDVRFNNITAMLAFFVNIMICRRGHSNDTWTTDSLKTLHHFRSWSREDLFYVLSVRTWHSLFQQTLVIGRLDECDEESRSWFLRQLSKIYTSDHSRCSWIITSQEESGLKQEISQWSFIDLHKIGYETAKESMAFQAIETAATDFVPTLVERDFLFCIGFAVRPLTFDELEIMAQLNDKSKTSISHLRNELFQRITDRSHPLLYVENNQIYSRQPSSDSPDSSTASKAHADLARRCLIYLQDPTVHQEIVELCSHFNSVGQQPISPPRYNLISYAVMCWSSHYRLAGIYCPFQQAVEFFDSPQNRKFWSKVYHILANPLVRLNRSYLSPLPLLSILGLNDLVTEFIHRGSNSPGFGIDCNLSLVEAARNGHTQTAQLLIEAAGIQEPWFEEVVTEAASFGVDGILHETVQRACTLEKFGWPPDLLLRVTSLGLHDTTKVLLNSGVEVNPLDPLNGKSPLHLACLNGHFETVKVILDANPDLHCLMTSGRTPLQAAAMNGHPEIVQHLLNAGSNIESLDNSDLSAIQLAIMRGRTAALEVLLSAGGDLNHGKEGADDPAWAEKPLLYCARFGYIQGMQLLLNHDADLNCKSDKLSPLYLAVQKSYIDISRMLLEKGAEPNEAPVGFDLLLLKALGLESDSFEMVKTLLDHGARIEEEDPNTHWRNTALSRVAGTDNVELLKYLLKRGADVNHVGKGSTPPIYTAAWNGKFENVRILFDAGADIHAIVEYNNWRPVVAAYDNPKILRFLLEKGANANTVSDSGTCLHLATMHNFLGSVKLLLSHSPKPDLEIPNTSSRQPDSDNKYTALGLACEYGHSRFVRLLLEAGANKYHGSRLGKCPLDICVQSGSLDAACVLLEYRVSLDHSNDEGNTVLHYISNDTPLELVRMLVNGGADFHTPNKKGLTPLQKAVESANPDVVNYLLFKKADYTRCSDAAPSLIHIACSKNNFATVRALAKVGANIQHADSIKEGSSLLIALTETWETPDMRLLKYLVETGKVDVNRRAGYIQYPLMAACAFQHIPTATYLLEHGANPNIEDSGGRRPLHLAPIHSYTDFVDMLLNFNAESIVNGQPLQDRMGRSPMHCAAVGGNMNTFRRISEIYDESELTRPDKDGWTPLFWALLNDSVDIELIQHLIHHGADLWARVRSRKAEWSPLKLARYIGVPDTICDILTPRPLVRFVDSKNKEEQWDEEFHFSRKAAKNGNKICDNCRVSIRGINYGCRSCPNYDLCFRCYMSRNCFHLFHPGQDDWEETGPEYVDDENTTSNDESQRGGDTNVWDDGTSQTEADSPGHDSDNDYHDGDENENDKGVDELDDLSSDTDSFQDADSPGDISGDDADD